MLVASGVEYGRLDIERLRDFEGAGVYYAATEMEASLCRGDEVVVVGGGNSAGQAIVFLSRYAKKVNVVLRSQDLGKSMSRYLVDRVRVHSEREDPPRVRGEVAAGQRPSQPACSSASRMAETLDIETDALFMFIGASPHTGWLRGCVQLDSKGFVLTGRCRREGGARSQRVGCGRP